MAYWGYGGFEPYGYGAYGPYQGFSTVPGGGYFDRGMGPFDMGYGVYGYGAHPASYGFNDGTGMMTNYCGNTFLNNHKAAMTNMAMGMKMGKNGPYDENLFRQQFDYMDWGREGMFHGLDKRAADAREAWTI
jgi:hypothetical protein